MTEQLTLFDFIVPMFKIDKPIRNSQTQLYRQSGNSICVNVLVAIFGQMIPGKEREYDKR